MMMIAFTISVDSTNSSIDDIMDTIDYSGVDFHDLLDLIGGFEDNNSD